nr:DNA primase [Clostridia bacterium]
MTIYDTIKAAVSVPQAAAYYGMKIQRNNMTRCCFHDDHHPSLKLNDTYFYCFACLEHGDVIDLVAQLHHESHYAAVQRIARDFGIDPNSPATAAAKPCLPRRNPDENLCRSVLTDYEQLLKRWRRDYAPATAEAPIDARYVEACQMLPAITDMIDALFQADAELRARVVRQVVQDGTIPHLKERLDKLRKEAVDGSESPCAAA